MDDRLWHTCYWYKEERDSVRSDFIQCFVAFDKYSEKEFSIATRLVRLEMLNVSWPFSDNLKLLFDIIGNSFLEIMLHLADIIRNADKNEVYQLLN